MISSRWAEPYIIVIVLRPSLVLGSCCIPDGMNIQYIESCNEA